MRNIDRRRRWGWGLSIVAVMCNILAGCRHFAHERWFFVAIHVILIIAVVVSALRAEKTYKELKRIREKYCS